jgi:hypothetical protein
MERCRDVILKEIKKTRYELRKINRVIRFDIRYGNHNPFGRKQEKQEKLKNKIIDLETELKKKGLTMREFRKYVKSRENKTI